ncbi:FKBP-type peptidyl-prolyl cis-trans isomerase SlyD [Thalassocella blandensis]|nr:FKBP-type peptidyl-prolyl cis-trans isomerase SlyD [Thalassocella blandensis]
MKVAKNSVVSIHYTLTAEDGSVIDSSFGQEPLSYLAGCGNIIPGLDDALMGLEPGDKKQVTVPPEEGYGAIEEDLIQNLPRNMFTGIDAIEVGMEFETQNTEGESMFVIVTEVSDTEITVDGNHELAGQILNFDVQVEGVREATAEEIEHGHAH